MDLPFNKTARGWGEKTCGVKGTYSKPYTLTVALCGLC